VFAYFRTNPPANCRKGPEIPATFKECFKALSGASGDEIEMCGSDSTHLQFQNKLFFKIQISFLFYRFQMAETWVKSATLQKSILMPPLKIPYLKDLFPENPATIAQRLVSSGIAIKIDQINWKQFPHQPGVKAFLGYCDQKLWIHYVVLNDFVRAICRVDQEPVWQDSCVEFFVKQGDIYRNFEFNSLGVCLSAFGPNREKRQRLDSESMAQILRFPSLTVENFPDESLGVDWSLTVAIPLELIGVKAGSQFYANFYKCGDETKLPHYLSWMTIDTPSPDFHRPGYFAPAELIG